MNLKKLLDKTGDVLRNPVLRPAEIWLLRVIFTAIAAWIGLDITDVV